ncbi:DUF4351 domain-containing protein [Altericista sp. CCNU0014]|uniref:DUF4351 domain-containing protein n=1 Tax=Altericista sp. CCNU0014 TaxID=3082949 RepID=UPI00384B6CCA
MLGLSELRETKVYQEALQEGEERGEIKLVLRLLTRRIGEIAPDLTSQVEDLSIAQVEALGEALLEFTALDNLVEWLRSQSISKKKSH